ncbi:Transglutaminase-like [Syntrophomonas zehnderi OL-4]|uniref:Transglutaminase-like n=1 Tax=Syntrophomonas zehnderi OL-4 TaxID=690567 RepID=A0A0E4C971_9FIRM|nr:transglutaminase-like domain-containing protein [Syntrophomonas zehnderi]CFX88790.1 Transglutaminase-like [Syntrophomonas zehnderi OL-4]
MHQSKGKLIITLGLSLALLLVPASAWAVPLSLSIDKSHIDKGIISVQYEQDNDSDMAIKISKDTISYDYRLSPGETYPLQAGDGKYMIMIGQAKGGNRYELIAKEEISLSLSEPHIVFLQSIQLIDWNQETPAVVKARELVKSARSDQERVALVYDYIVKNITYDNQKARTVQIGYIPKLDQVYSQSTGICYDYAALTAAMLRSVGVPAKLVTGYHKNDPAVYHAWNQVYLRDSKQWITIDTTYDSIIIKAGQYTPMIKNAADYIPHKFY